MKKIFTILLCSCAVIVKAQPTMTAANEAAVGLTFNYVYVDSSMAMEGPGGINQTWNFAGATPNGLIHTDQWQAPAATPYSANFPGADLVQVTADTAGNTMYLYHNTSASQTELMGTGVNAGFDVITTYTNTQILRQFPTTYNTTLSDNYAGSFTITQGPVTITDYRSGTYTMVADGYGTLVTPAGTYTNALRAKIRQHTVDSMVYVGIPLPANVTHYNTTTYFYGSTNAGNRLYQFYIGYDTVVTSGSTMITKNASYLGTVTGIQETLPYETASAGVYPNPANDHAVIKLSNSVKGTAELTLYDLKGSVVKNISTQMTAASRYEWMFSIRDLEPGLYHVRIVCGDKQWQTKIVKQ